MFFVFSTLLSADDLADARCDFDLFLDFAMHRCKGGAMCASYRRSDETYFCFASSLPMTSNTWRL